MREIKEEKKIVISPPPKKKKENEKPGDDVCTTLNPKQLHRAKLRIL